MRRIVTHIAIPVTLWEAPIPWVEKAVLTELSTYPSAGGVSVQVGALATALNITKNECRQAIKNLHKRHALDVVFDEDGRQRYVPHLYNEDFRIDESREVADCKPKETVNIDYDEVVRMWAQTNPALPQISRFTPQRKRKLRSLLRNTAASIEDVYRAFRIVAVSGFLQNGTDGQWKATYDWLIDHPDKFIKVLEGGYTSAPSERAEYERIMGAQEVDTEIEDYYS